MARIKFKFSVDNTGKFTYEPSGDWKYVHTDKLSFQAPNGPFSVTLRRIDNAAGGAAIQNPFGGDLHATLDPATNQWVAKVPAIQDGLSDAQRRNIFQAQGFIAKYRYLIGVLKDGKVLIDDAHNGTHQC